METPTTTPQAGNGHAPGPDLEPTDISELMRRIGRVMGAVSVLAEALPQDCAAGEADFRSAAEGIHDQLEQILEDVGEIESSVELGGEILIDAPRTGRIVCRLVRGARR
ncbi:MAG: hypothetical protein WD793_10795 [Steroidobacteraceae bacterium]